MRAFGLLVLALDFGLCLHSAFSQCCCSGAEITITDGAGDPLQTADIKLSEVARVNNGRFQFRDKDGKDAVFQFHVGCGNGKETLLIESGSSVMRIRFKLYGEFGHPKAEIVFTHGDYVAEFVKEREDEFVRKITIRPAEPDEMKHVEPTPAKDEPSDETAKTSGSFSETRRQPTLSSHPICLWTRLTDLFPKDRNS